VFQMSSFLPLATPFFSSPSSLFLSRLDFFFLSGAASFPTWHWFLTFFSPRFFQLGVLPLFPRFRQRPGVAFFLGSERFTRASYFPLFSFFFSLSCEGSRACLHLFSIMFRDFTTFFSLFPPDSFFPCLLPPGCSPAHKLVSPICLRWFLF